MIRHFPEIRVVGLALCAGLLLVACRADTEGLRTLSVSQVNERATAGEIVLCDANTADVRSEFGVIRGARLLSNYRDYDVVLELPEDKSSPLVFYCHSPFCSAAVDAARKAVAAGYGAVSVMPDGIQGWVDAQLPVEAPDAV